MHRLSAQHRAAGLNPNVHIIDFPDRCPQCHQTGLQTFAGSAWFSGAHETEITLSMRCPNQDCNTIYLALYWVDAQDNLAPPHNTVRCGLVRCTPHKPLGYSADPILDSVSPQFREIATQANSAESSALLHVCGPGYRKALEFLVKDFLINHTFKDDAPKQDNVRKMALANVIANYIADTRIQGLAARAAWIGNDETHYERVQGDHDLEDLKNLLHLTALYLAAELHADHYMETLNKPSAATP